VRKGQAFKVIARQLTDRTTRVIDAIPGAKIERNRHVLGAFQLTIPVRVKEVMLQPEERNLSVLRWIGDQIQPGDRWAPVFDRYLQLIADRVKALGGDPDVICASPTGNCRLPKRRRHEREYTGKIAGLIYDRFGDFEGFLLETEADERRFFSRERAVEELARRAWQERTRVSVFVERDEDERPHVIVLRS
jgi:hypothetical protein